MPSIIRRALLISCLVSANSVVLAAECLKCTKEFQKCMAQTEGMTYAIQECQTKEEEIQEARLNSAYKNALTKLTPERRKEFREVQRRWLAYRSASSRFYIGTGLSGYKITSSAVWLDLTASRVQELHGIDY